MKKIWVAAGAAAAVAVLGGGSLFVLASNSETPRDSVQPRTSLTVTESTVVIGSPLPAPSAAPDPAPEQPSKAHFGTFVSEAPASAVELAAAKRTIDEVKATGLNVVYQYSFVQGTTQLNAGYLDYAAKQGVQVIIDLHDLYDGRPAYPQGGSNQEWLAVLSQNLGQHFASNDQVVDYIVKTFGAHGAVRGFCSSDEQPEDAGGLAKWSSLLANRYKQIKQLTNKPVLLTMMGDQPQSFFAALRGMGDELAADYYPVGNAQASEATALTRIHQDVKAAGWKQSWAVLQAFSMPDKDYGMPDVATSNAHFPSAAELVAMGQQAHAGGANHVLFFAWGAVQMHHQQATVKAAVDQLRELYE